MITKQAGTQHIPALDFVLKNYGICSLGYSKSEVDVNNVNKIKLDNKQGVYCQIYACANKANCVHCHYFMTGKALLPNLIAQRNKINNKVIQSVWLVEKYMRIVKTIDDVRIKGGADVNDELYLPNKKLGKYQLLLKEVVLKAEKLQIDYNAVYNLITKLRSI